MNSNPGRKSTRILCIQLKQLGDVLMTTAAVRSLFQGLDNCEIDFLTQKPSNAIYDDSPYVRWVYCVRWKARELLPMIFNIRRQKYDVLIDFSGSSKTALLAWMSGIPKRIGYHGQKNSWCFTETVQVPDDRVYTAERKAMLIAPLGVELLDSGIDFFLPADAVEKFSARAQAWRLIEKPLFAVSPVSKHVFKVWPAERFAEICDRLIERYGGQIFFLVGPGEKHFAEKVSAKMKHECLPIVDNLSLTEAACLLELSTCYFGNDNGLMHLSVARNRPTFAVFGRHGPSRWQAPMRLHEAVDFDPGCKSNCCYPDCKIECLSEISVDIVWRRLSVFVNSLPLI